MTAVARAVATTTIISVTKHEKDFSFIRMYVCIQDKRSIVLIWEWLTEMRLQLTTTKT